jgi:aminoglycoside 6'-N-acetyltransferase I
MTVNIISITADDHARIEQMGQIMVDAFAENWSNAWKTLAEGIEEAHEALQPERICRVAVDEAGKVLGWIGGIPMYDGNVWELHPLAVSPKHQGKGIGRLLVADFERHVAERGGITIYLGSDDENSMTSLAGVDLYDNLWERIAHIRNFKNHPYSFYEKVKYSPPKEASFSGHAWSQLHLRYVLTTVTRRGITSNYAARC